MFIWVGYKQGPGHWVHSEQCVLVATASAVRLMYVVPICVHVRVVVRTTMVMELDNICQPKSSSLSRYFHGNIFIFDCYVRTLVQSQVTYQFIAKAYK